MGQAARDDYRVGLTLYQQGHYAQAVAHFQSAAQADPSFWQAYQVLGQCKYQLGDKAGALSAFDQSLQIHPDNPTLRDFADKIRKAVSSTSSGNSGSRPVSALGMSPRPMVNPASQMKPAFVQVYGTLGNSVLTDLNTGYRTLNNLTSGPNSNNQSYFPYAGMGVEMGYCPDPNDCFSMNMELASVYGFSINNGDPTDEFIEKLSNQLLTLGVNYSYLTPGKDGPWIARFGVAYYLLGFSYYQSEVDASAGVTQQVSLPSGSGNGLGASVALGKDFDIGGLSLELLGKVKVGTISQMTGAYTTTGSPIPFLWPSGTGALAVGSDGSLNLVDQARMEASGERYALMELLGYELRIGLSYGF
jgi:tetratricopeptide (TPR) repeat protein